MRNNGKMLKTIVETKSGKQCYKDVNNKDSEEIKNKSILSSDAELWCNQEENIPFHWVTLPQSSALTCRRKINLPIAQSLKANQNNNQISTFSNKLNTSVPMPTTITPNPTADEPDHVTIAKKKQSMPSTAKIGIMSMKRNHKCNTNGIATSTTINPTSVINENIPQSIQDNYSKSQSFITKTGQKKKKKKKSGENHNHNTEVTRAILEKGDNVDSSTALKHTFLLQRECKEMKMISQANTNDLSEQIDELERLLAQKKAYLVECEKIRLNEQIEDMKPITMLKKLNEFCAQAKRNELDVLRKLLSKAPSTTSR